jgi:serine/threonine protein kinase
LTDVRLPLSPEKWVKIRDIYDRLLNVPEAERIALAHTLCEGDTEIEAETWSLLSAHAKAGSFLHGPAAEALESIASKKFRRELCIGTVLATRFRILELLNTGGMGSVYEAFDSELQEVVALKTIRPEIASEAAIIDRFKQEVRQARQITHPNVCRVYDLFNHDLGPGDRIWFLTMQLLPGTTLLDHIRKNGPVPAKEAFVLVQQMVAGLTAAHQHGIIHRDFKSSNVMLVPDAEGSVQAVITDFGLALQTTAVGLMENSAGQGTPSYVAPEQWNKGVVAPAGDQYSLGVVMCEMLTGERPTTASRNEGSAPPARLPAGKSLDARWESAIRRCLEVNPANRFASLDDLLAAIDPGRVRRMVIRWTAAAAALSVLVALGFLIVKTANELPTLADLKQITPEMDFSVGASLSRDARTITYVSDRANPGNQDVWIQQLPDGPSRRLTTNPAVDEHPSVSPDGKTVAFESSRNHPGIYDVDVESGTERFLVPGGHEPQFSSVDRSIVYWTGDEYLVQPGSKIYRYDLNSGRSTRLAPERTDAADPVWNSDGQHILFVACGGRDSHFPACNDWWVTRSDGSPARNTGAKAILDAQQLHATGYFGGWQGSTAVFSALHGSSTGLWSIKIDPESGRVYGMAEQLLPGNDRDFIITSSLAGNSLAFCQMNPAMHIWRIDNATHAADAKTYRVTHDPEFDFDPSVSGDGNWLVFARGYSDDRKLYIADTSSRTERALNLPGSSKLAPILNQSGSSMAYEAVDNGVPSIYLADLKGGQRKLCTGCRYPTGWLQQPESLIYADEALSEIRAVDISGANARTILSIPGKSVGDGVWSAQNHFILYTVSTPDYLGQIFATRLQRGASQPEGQPIKITEQSEVSRKPAWSGDGRTIFYLSKRDGFWCVWGQRFDPGLGQLVGKPFPIRHFHDLKLSPMEIGKSEFNLSASGDSLYLNVVETGGTIWVGKLVHKSLLTK